MAAFLYSRQSSAAPADIAAINITPLVDVMLVLLIIFMVAAPVLTRQIELALPQGVPNAPAPPGRTIDLRIDASGAVFWNGASQPLSVLQDLMAVEAQRVPRERAPPLLRIDASGEADYGVVAKVLAAANNAQLQRIAFVPH